MFTSFAFIDDVVGRDMQMSGCEEASLELGSGLGAASLSWNYSLNSWLPPKNFPFLIPFCNTLYLWKTLSCLEF